MKVRYYTELDGVRGIAALMVVGFHFFQPYINSTGVLKDISRIAFIGQTGVTLFFVLSGFLITRILLNAKGGKAYFSAFYVRRALRIFPLYFIFLAVYYFVIPPLQNVEIKSFGMQWPYWTYLQNFALTFKWSSAGPQHFWSLAVEEHFYLFWPFLVYFTNIRSLKVVIFTIFPVVLLCRYFLVSTGHEIYYFTFTTIDGLALGALLAVQEYESKLLSIKQAFYIALVLLPLIAVTWLLTSGKALFLIQIFKLSGIAFLFYLMISIVISFRKANNPVTYILNSAPLSFCGRISYGVYVYHVICIHALKNLFPSVNLVSHLLLSVAATIAVASISYYLIENQFLRLKNKFVY